MILSYKGKSQHVFFPYTCTLEPDGKVTFIDEYGNSLVLLKNEAAMIGRLKSRLRHKKRLARMTPEQLKEFRTVCQVKAKAYRSRTKLIRVRKGGLEKP